MAKLTNYVQWTIYNIIDWQILFTWLKITSAQVVETSATNNSSFQNYPHLDDHTIQTTHSPGFKPFTILYSCLLKGSGNTENKINKLFLGSVDLEWSLHTSARCQVVSLASSRGSPIASGFHVYCRVGVDDYPSRVGQWHTILLGVSKTASSLWGTGLASPLPPPNMAANKTSREYDFTAAFSPPSPLILPLDVVNPTPSSPPKKLTFGP